MFNHQNFVFVFFNVIEKPQKSFDDLFQETSSKKQTVSYKDDDSDDDFKMSDESDDDFVPKSGIISTFINFFPIINISQI